MIARHGVAGLVKQRRAAEQNGVGEAEMMGVVMVMVLGAGFDVAPTGGEKALAIARHVMLLIARDRRVRA